MVPEKKGSHNRDGPEYVPEKIRFSPPGPLDAEASRA